MRPARFHILKQMSTALMVAVLAACSSAPVVTTPTPTAPPPTPSDLPSTPRPTVTFTSFQTPTPGHNRIAATIPLSSPSNMAVGDGLIWVIAGSSVVRIDPKANQVVGKPIPAGVRFESAVAFDEGALWVSIVGSGDLGAPSDDDSVSRIDPETGESVATLKVNRAPMSLAITPGAVWVVQFGNNGESVWRIDPQTNQIVDEPIVTGLAPIELALGDGALWVANHDADTVTRIDPTTHQVVASIALPSAPHRIAYGEGAVWVANWHDNSVSRIDPQTNQVVVEHIPIGFTAGNIAAGHGSVWVTSDYRSPIDGDPENVVVVRIDPQTNQAVETIPVGGHPIDVAITEDAVWVSVQRPDMIVRINP